MFKKRKICVITGSRAEYGLMYLTMKRIQKSKELDLQIIATGTHLSSTFGNTIKEIESDGFKVNQRINILNNDDSSQGIAKSMSKVMEILPKYLKEMKPDLLLILGDRVEIFSSGAVATVLNIPIAHISGGETTEGAFDEPFRHSITKMSHLHFVSTETYRNRVIQLGENPGKVFNVGSTGVERIKKLKLIPKEKVEDYIGIKLNKTNFLITIHPETLNIERSAKDQFINLFSVLEEIKETSFIFTKSNSDTGGISLNRSIEDFVGKDKTTRVLHSSLGQEKYISLLNNVDAVIGNSSSGLVEAPTLGVPTINIGDRQKGRIRPDSVIDTDFSEESLRRALESLNKKEFKKKLESIKNPFDGGATSKNIVKILETHPLENLLKKRFYDN
jgi:GDP/UDP-N,N'-diacetylbacillosamine 2-epimerase (hydrolysing)